MQDGGIPGVSQGLGMPTWAAALLLWVQEIRALKASIPNVISRERQIPSHPHSLLS